MTKMFTSSCKKKNGTKVASVSKEETVWLVIHIMHFDMYDTQNRKKNQQRKCKDGLYIKKSSFSFCNLACSFSQTPSEESPKTLSAPLLTLLLWWKANNPRPTGFSSNNSSLFNCSSLRLLIAQHFSAFMFWISRNGVTDHNLLLQILKYFIGIKGTVLGRFKSHSSEISCPSVMASHRALYLVQSCTCFH